MRYPRLWSSRLCHVGASASPRVTEPRAGPRPAASWLLFPLGVQGTGPHSAHPVSRLGVAAHGESWPCLQPTPEATSCTVPDIQMFSMVPYVLNVTAVHPWGVSSSFVPFVPEHISKWGAGGGGGGPPACSCSWLSLSPPPPPTCHTGLSIRPGSIWAQGQRHREMGLFPRQPNPPGPRDIGSCHVFWEETWEAEPPNPWLAAEPTGQCKNPCRSRPHSRHQTQQGLGRPRICILMTPGETCCGVLCGRLWAHLLCCHRKDWARAPPSGASVTVYNVQK